MVALGGLFGTFVGFTLALHLELLFLLTTIIIVSGFVGFARLKLKAHSEGQVYGGFALGAIFMLGLFLFL